MDKSLTTEKLRWPTVVFYQALLVNTIVISGCGSENAATSPESELNEVRSTALADNPISEVFQFDSYQHVNVSLNVADYAADMTGNVYVVKVSDEDLNTVYLSSHQANDQLSIEFSVPLTHSYAVLEVFTDIGSEGSIMQEINL